LYTPSRHRVKPDLLTVSTIRPMIPSFIVAVIRPPDYADALPPGRRITTIALITPMLAIKLSRVGKKKQPSYRVVVTEKSRDPWGKNNEIVGFYNPLSTPKEITFKEDRVKYWLSQGAQPTDTVHNLLVSAGIIDAPKRKAHPTHKLSAEELAELEEKKKKEAEAAKKKEEEAKAAQEAEAEEPASEKTPTETKKEESANEASAEETPEEEPQTKEAPSEKTPDEQKEAAKPKEEDPKEDGGDTKAAPAEEKKDAEKQE